MLSGRSLVDCDTGNKIERDYEEYEGLDDWSLTCKGIGRLKDETITLCGPNGQSNSAGESLEVVSPNWPESEGRVLIMALIS